MRAMLATSLTLFGLVYFTSAFTVHQHGAKEHCVDLQCPATAMDYGVKNLVDEESMASEQCTSCEQCTSNGYSLCMRVNTVSRASRNSAGFCSCSHSVPANCHNQLAEDKQPVNITMQMYRMCYSSAVQAPTRPLAVNEKASVIITVESFWSEPYWRELELSNLTLHYEYSVKNPDHCDGNILTTEGFSTDHLCVNTVGISMDGSLEGEDGEDAAYPDEYDNELPPEVQIDREVFADAKLLKTFYTVNVRRPRQLDSNGGNDPFRDINTEIESEVLKFDLKPEIFGDGTVASAEKLPEAKEETKEEPHPTSVEAERDEDDVSEERGGTDFFDEAKKNPIEKTIEEEERDDQKSDELAEKEEEALEKAIVEESKHDDHKEDEETETDKVEEDKKEHEDDEEKQETDDKSEEVTEKETEDEEKDDEKTEDAKDDEKDEKHDADDKETETEKTVDEETETDDEKKESEEKSGETEDTTEIIDETTTDADEGSEEAEDKENEDEKNNEETEEKNFLKSFLSRENSIRTIFIVVISCCLLMVACVLCKKNKMCCFRTSETKTGVNGHRYSNPNKNELVCSQPEKERLHQ